MHVKVVRIMQCAREGASFASFMQSKLQNQKHKGGYRGSPPLGSPQTQKLTKK